LETDDSDNCFYSELLDEIIQSGFGLGEDAQYVKWANFLDDAHIVAAVSLQDPTAKYVKPLRVIVLSIASSAITASLDLPRVEHVSAFAFHRSSATFCFAEETNAHVYHLAPTSVTLVCF
jgi:hypothetical protein